MKKLLVVLLCLSFAIPASAQQRGPSLDVDTRLRAPAPPERYTDLRRGRAFLAVGTALILAGIGGIGAAYRGVYCHGSGQQERNPGWGWGGAPLIAMGAVFTYRGVVRMRRSGLREQHRFSPGLIPLAIGTALTGAATWFLVGGDKWMDCISS